jgi:ankyrin repeat protein
LLLDNGADVDARTKDGTTALKIAQEKGHKEIVALLKAHGAKD